MPSNDENLDQIQQELHAALEDRITELLGCVRAAQKIATRISLADQELARYETVRAQLGDDEDARAEVAALEQSKVRIQSIRSELMANLTGLTGELQALSTGDTAS